MSHPHLLTRFALLATLGVGMSACSDRNGVGDPPGPAPSTLGDTFVVTSAGRILSFVATTPSVIRTSVAVTGLAPGETILDVDTRPAMQGAVASQLYALANTGRLYVIDPTNGAATAVGAAPIVLGGTAVGIDFNPLPDRLRVVTNTGQNLRVNPADATVTTDTPLTRNGRPQMGVSGIAYTNSFPDGCTTKLYYIDTRKDLLLTTSAPNDGVLTVVGPLGVDAKSVKGFDLSSDAANGRAILTVDGVAGLYFIDTATGAATLRGAVAGLNAGETPVGLAGQINDDGRPGGNTIALTETNRLITFNRADPTRTCTTVDLFVVNADGDEVPDVSILGIDVRPADGSLYGLVSDGSIVVIDPPSGEADVVVAALLASDGATPEAPTPLALSGTDFGFDFNPMADRLRIVSNTGQNLAVNLDADADAINTTVGTGLNRQNVTAAGYTNSDPAADPPATTTLFYVDVATDQLFSTAAPNDGVLDLVGPLGVDVDSLNGFDIDGSTNSALFASNAPGATTSSLYAVDLTTGAASLQTNPTGGGVIGAGSAAGPERIRGLAVSP